MNDYDKVAEDAFNEYQADLSKEKAIEIYKDELRKQIEELKASDDVQFDKGVMIAEIPPKLLKDMELHRELWNTALDKVLDLLNPNKERL